MIKEDVFDKIRQVKDAIKDETVIFPVTEQPIETKYSPYIEVLLNDIVIARIDFEIDLTITLKAAILKFRNRKLQEIDAGECLIDGSLKCESVEITKFSSTITIPGIIDFKKETVEVLQNDAKNLEVLS